ncbi:MAG: hypothetical protein M3O70_04630, partial [Actinomycetota bacterium]|nr:hypothetical protein [Actinomycetota bacterium]
PKHPALFCLSRLPQGVSDRLPGRHVNLSLPALRRGLLLLTLLDRLAAAGRHPQHGSRSRS